MKISSPFSVALINTHDLIQNPTPYYMREACEAYEGIDASNYDLSVHMN